MIIKKGTIIVNIEDRLQIVKEPKFEGFGEKQKKVADFYFTLDNSEIATGLFGKNKFSYQLHMGEFERLDLYEDMQRIVHGISILANKLYKTGWTLSYYDKESWKRNPNYLTLEPEQNKKLDFIQKLKDEQEKRKKERKEN